jgi:hypothetical protein
MIWPGFEVIYTHAQTVEKPVKAGIKEYGIGNIIFSNIYYS